MRYPHITHIHLPATREKRTPTGKIRRLNVTTDECHFLKIVKYLNLYILTYILFDVYRMVLRIYYIPGT